jgi:hypothetical protein
MSALAIALVLISALFHKPHRGLRQTSIVFAVLMGSHFLQEKHQGIRLTGS